MWDIEKAIKTIVLLLIGCFPRVLGATETPPPPIEDPNKASLIDEGQSFLSQQIFKITNTIDSYFGNKGSFDEPNGSKFKLYYLLSKEGHSAFQQEPNIKIVLKLPEFEKRFRFRLGKRPNGPRLYR